MKNILCLLFIFFGVSTFAQNKKMEKVTFQTSAKCEECKERIEKALAYEKGVKSSELNLENFAVSITYNAEKTNPASLKKAISLAGYDADEVKADKKAYNALPLCCKKGH